MEQLHLLQAGEAIWINSGFRRHCWGYRANRETYIGMGILTLIQTRSFGMTGKGSTDKSSTDKKRSKAAKVPQPLPYPLENA